MSTILNALKRAEQDSPDHADKTGSSSTLNIRTTLNSRLTRQRSRSHAGFKPFLMAFAITIGVVVCGWLFFQYKGHSPEPPSQTTASDSSPLPFPESKRQKSKIRQPVLKPQLTTASEQKNDAAPKSVTVFPDKKNGLKVPGKNTLSISEITQPGTQKKQVHIEQSEKTVSPAESRLDSGSNEKDQTIDDTDKALETIMPKESGLKIQAISWANDPADRVAVINNKILEEGDSVSGYHLLRIEKDQVILQRSGRTYKLDFKYQ